MHLLVNLYLLNRISAETLNTSKSPNFERTLGDVANLKLQGNFIQGKTQLVTFMDLSVIASTFVAIAWFILLLVMETAVSFNMLCIQIVKKGSRNLLGLRLPIYSHDN